MPTEFYFEDGDYLVEESTGGITAHFKDEDDQSFTPVTATWTWTDESGSVINSREDVAISSLSTNNTIVLSGDDLAFQSGETGDSVNRVLTIEGTYNSAEFGNGKPFKDQLIVPVFNLTAVS